MTLDTANRAFIAIVAVGATVFALLAVAACCLVGVVAYRVGGAGISGFTQTGSEPVLVFFALTATGAIFVARSARAQVRATRRLTGQVHGSTLPTPAAVRRAAHSAGLQGRVSVIDADAPFSFTYGMGRPRVAVSSGLIDGASGEELAAVLHHEAYHVRNYDPLKVVLARSVPAGLFFLPALGHLRRRYVAGRELAADRRAMSAVGTAPLATALYRVAGGPSWSDLGAAAAIGGNDALEERVSQLESGAEPALPSVSSRGLVASLFGGGVLLWSVVASLVALGPAMARFCTGA